jgi:hypothetical protein
MQTNFKQYQTFLLNKWNSRRFSAALIVCFVIWTPLLVTETLQIQHSCHPMINFLGKLPTECNTSPFSSPLLPPPGIPISNLDAGQLGIAVGATAAALGVPVPIAAGLGILTWIAAKSIGAFF